MERIKEAYSLLCGHKESISEVPGTAGWFKVSKPDIEQVYFWHAPTGKLSRLSPEVLEQREEANFKGALKVAEMSISRLQTQVTGSMSDAAVQSAQQAGGLKALQILLELLAQAHNSLHENGSIWDVVLSAVGKVAESITHLKVDALQETNQDDVDKSKVPSKEVLLTNLSPNDHPPLPLEEDSPPLPPPPLPPSPVPPGDEGLDGEEPHRKKVKKINPKIIKPPKGAGDLMSRWAQAHKELNEDKGVGGGGDDDQWDAWRATQIRTGSAQNNPNFMPLPGMWSDRSGSLRPSKKKSSNVNER